MRQGLHVVHTHHHASAEVARKGRGTEDPLWKSLHRCPSRPEDGPYGAHALNTLRPRKREEVQTSVLILPNTVHPRNIEQMRLNGAENR